MKFRFPYAISYLQPEISSVFFHIIGRLYVISLNLPTRSGLTVVAHFNSFQFKTIVNLSTHIYVLTFCDNQSCPIKIEIRDTLGTLPPTGPDWNRGTFCVINYV